MKSRGAEWHKWDLHVHTPSSSLCYKNKSVSNADIIATMINNGISVFAVTDHHLIDIDRFKELTSLAAHHSITVLPGMEFLSDARGKEPIHFIGIFPEDKDISFIHEQIKNRTGIAEALRDSLPLNEVYCRLDDTIKLIHSLGGIVSIHAGQKTNSVEKITNSLPHTRAQKKDIAELIDIFELGKEIDQTGYKDIVFPAIGKTIPMILCSDCHDTKNYTVKQNLWIKGSCNFEGLKYALNEPEDRFYIGDEPPILSRVRDNKTKYIDSILIKRTGTQDKQQIWFEDIQIPINKELTTIIGNKGSGKSALSDIISFCSDSSHSKDYTFLNKEKFKKKGYADRFVASITFENNSTTEQKNLLSENENTNIPRVTYLPQSYFEKVCNEIDKIEAFRTEIEKVVFQYVPDHEKLGQGTFQKLILYKKQSIASEIRSISDEIEKLNKDIINIEDTLSPEYKQRIGNELKIKKEELDTHKASQPQEVASPEESHEAPGGVEKKKALEILRSERTSVEEEIAKTQEQIKQLAIDIEDLVTFKKDVQIKLEEIDSIIAKNNHISTRIDFDLSSTVKICFDEHALNKAISTATDKKNELLQKIGDNETTNDETLTGRSLRFRLSKIITKIKEIESQFSKEEKEYQAYISAIKKWKEKITEIQGTNEQHGSLKYLEHLLANITNTYPTKLQELREQRISFAAEIFEKRHEIKRIYDSAKEGIDNQLRKTKVADLKIATTFSPHKDFETTLLSHIKQNTSGSFYGSVDGAKILNENIVSQVDWNDTSSIKMFLNTFIDYLEHDKRPNSKSFGHETFIGNIIKDRNSFYNYLFKLDYLVEHYDLQQNGKNLDKLSPGEKGALLLVFYLILDKDDVPLIIDQPEDNLDNKSVANILVPFIKEAKQRRQIIMVTHNPNLAVVADSEQVIRVNIDKDNGNTFSFEAGGIETADINSQIVDVLEGTIRAFTVRKNKYAKI